MNKFTFLFIAILFFSCKNRVAEFSFSPTHSENPILVSELGEDLEILEIQTDYPISGNPIIFKSGKYFYLFEQGIITSLHQIHLSGKHRKSLDFGFDDKLNADAITQVILDQNRVGIITHGNRITWFDEDLEEIGTEELPVKAKFHFRKGENFIAHTNGIDDDDWDIVTYGSDGVKSYLPVDKRRYGFYNQTFSPFSDYDGKVLFSQAFNDTIYIWDEKKFEPFFHVDFGNEAVNEDRYLQIHSAMDMLSFFNEKRYSFLQGEIFGIGTDKVLFQVNEKGKHRMGLLDFATDKLTFYPGLLDNSISGMSLFSPQFVQDGVLYFGVSGEQFLENYERLADSFKHRLSENYTESFFIYCLTLKD